MSDDKIDDTYSFKNFRLSLPTGVENKDEFIGCNLTQVVPHTKICEGKTGLVFTRCNLTNCDVPPDAVVNDCGGYGRHKSRCSHLHPELIAFGLSECVENCEHVVDTDEIWIDGVLIKKNYYYQDKRVIEK